MESVFGDVVCLEMDCVWRWSVFGDGVFLDIDCGECCLEMEWCVL